ncbi:glycoside hydrolase family 28 protein [bacterium]|nr:MAG: glycoside hydrolase family 28 protein [bacterium]
MSHFFNRSNSLPAKYRIPLSFALLTVAFSPLAAANAAGQSTAVFNVSAYGAKGDGTALNTTAIQSAIDAASKAGGGIVYLPAGKYLSGSLHLKSNVELRLERGAVLQGSTSRADYPRGNWTALLDADGQKNIKLSGSGTIDGQGLLLAKDVMRRAAQGEFGAQSAELNQSRLRSLELPDAEFSQKTLGNRANESDRPMIIRLTGCRNVGVAGVTLRNSSGWVSKYDSCDDVTIKGVKVDSTVYWNNDGFDITDCHNVKISDCDINSADDGICLKSGAGGTLGQGDEHSKNSRGCYNVNVSNCRVRSSASAFKMGTASFGGFRKIRVSNLTVYDTYRSAIALECVDGGTVDDVVVENVTAFNTGCAIFMRLGQRNTKAPTGVFQNVTIRNVKTWIPEGKPDAGYGTLVPSALAPNILPSAIAGIPGHPIRNVRLENIQIFHPGGGDSQKANMTTDKLDSVPERMGSYPEISMFGELPAWGFYVRHVEGLQLVNVHCARKATDYRPAMVFDDVQNLSLSDLAIHPELNNPDLFFRNVHKATLGADITQQMLHSGADSSDITRFK